MKEFILFCCLMFAGFSAKAFMVYGDEVVVGNGKARVFADITNQGGLNALGVALTEEAMMGLPDSEMEYEFNLKLPSILNIPPYNHIMMNWNPHGHEPENIYGLPHFDFHFYFISQEARSAITCQGADEAICLTQPAPEKLPPFYVPTPAGVPAMGWHWLDPRSPEFNGQTFTATFIYGYYAGAMAFIEPMITRDFIMKKQYFEKEIPVPQVFPAAGYYPQAYSLRYSWKHKLYLVSLKNFMVK